MEFPKLAHEFVIDRLRLPDDKVDMVLDTDTYNEIDDQFALVYAIRSPEKINMQAVYAAPFRNDRSASPEDGMEKSYEEILRVLEKLKVDPKGFVYKGSNRYLKNVDKPCNNEAVNDLIERATKATSPLYVVAIGAITNVASAIILEPEIIKKIVVVWLGGNPIYWPDTLEFNLQQDVLAAQVVFDCGVPLVHIPCMGVASHLLTTVVELEKYIDGRSSIGSYLTKIFREYSRDHFGWAKEIWDIAAIAYLVNAEWVPTSIIHSPVLTERLTWSADCRRHFMRAANYVNRNGVFRDLFSKM